MYYEEDLDKIRTCHTRTKFPTSPLASPSHCLLKSVRIFNRFSFKKKWLDNLLMANPISKVQMEIRLTESSLHVIPTS